MTPGFIVLTLVVSLLVAMAFLSIVARDVMRHERIIDLRFRIAKREREVEAELRTRKKSEDE